MDSLESLKRKTEGAGDLKSVVRTMKAMAAANISQYEMAVASLEDYYRTVALGMIAWFRQEHMETINKAENEQRSPKEQTVCAIVFGSDQGLVGQFNDTIAAYVTQTLCAMPGNKEVWAVGERVQGFLSDAGFNTTKLYPVPNSVKAITPLVTQILIDSEESHLKDTGKAFYIFHNQTSAKGVYAPIYHQLLPLDGKWKSDLEHLKWTTKKIPQVAGAAKSTLTALIHEYLFVTLFKACTESLASENTSRLNAMQRAEKNIEELLDDLNQKYNHLRQNQIDEELFDVVSGFEAMKEKGGF